MYHKVDIIQPTIWWVSPSALERQLDELGDRRFVFLEDYVSPATEVVLTFDDAFENVARHALPLLRAARVPFEVFVIGDVIGAWNEYDHPEPLTRHMGLDHLDEVVASGGRVQWHTRTHRDLARLDDVEIETELTVPEQLRERYAAPNLTWLAYPGGSHDKRAVASARIAFAGAVSVITGEAGDRWQQNRISVEESTTFSTPYLSTPFEPLAQSGADGS